MAIFKKKKDKDEEFKK
jgi:hypothetical protein